MIVLLSYTILNYDTDFSFLRQTQDMIDTQ